MALTDRYAPPRARIVRRSRRRRLLGGGTDGNEQLTAITAVILLVLFALLGITIIGIVQLLWLHLFLGVLLVGPVALKLGSTGYRFTRYYLGSPAYRRKGPPAPLLRLLGPFVVVLTVVVFASGIGLLLVPVHLRSQLLLVHKASFVLWFVAMVVHVLGHLLDTARLAPRDYYRATRRQVAGAGLRQWTIAAALGIGFAIGVPFLPRAGAFFQAIPHLGR